MSDKIIVNKDLLQIKFKTSRMCFYSKWEHGWISILSLMFDFLDHGLYFATVEKWYNLKTLIPHNTSLSPFRPPVKDAERVYGSWVRTKDY